MITKIDYASKTHVDEEGYPVYYEIKNPLLKTLPQYHFERGDICEISVAELIEKLEEVEDLNVVLISANGVCGIYENEDIEFIDEETLKLPVKRYDFQVENYKKHRCRIVDIKC